MYVPHPSNDYALGFNQQGEGMNGTPKTETISGPNGNTGTEDVH